MSFLNRLRDTLSSTTADLKRKAAQYNNRDFKDAVMAICALVAAADGTIDPTEKRKVAGLIASNDALQSYDVNELKALFDKFCDQVTSDPDFGPIAALKAVGKIKGKGEQPDVAVQIALVIANADGNFSNDEKARVREICRALGLDASQYGA